MRIGEAAELTGLSISNIRFYEKKGLLEPNREQQNKYRDYAAADISRLKQIVLYRKMDISLETIYLLLHQETTLTEVLEQQRCVLQEKQTMLQGTLALCEEVLADSSADQLDVDYYLNYVRTEEACGRRFADIEEVLTDFAIYTKFDLLLADPVVSRILRKPQAARIARMIWSVVWLLVPVIIIVESCLDGTGVSPAKLLYWLFIMAVLWGSFLEFRLDGHRSSQK